MYDDKEGIINYAPSRLTRMSDRFSSIQYVLTDMGLL